MSFQALDESSDEYELEAPSRWNGPGTKQVLVYLKACERCMRGKRDCRVDEGSTACVACRSKKYGCSHTGKSGLKSMWVVRPDSESGSDEEEEEEEGAQKGKKRRVETQKKEKEKEKERVKKEKEVKVKEEKTRPRPRPTAASKGKGKAKARPPPKSSAMVVDESDEQVEVVDDEMDVEPEAKRMRVAPGELAIH